MTDQDRSIVRDLARRVAEVAALPEMADRRTLWKAHNRLQPGRPMILIFPEGSWGELLPAEALQCGEEPARSIEAELRRRLYGYERFASDNVVDAEWVVGKAIRSTGWGVEPRRQPSPAARGAWAFDPVIRGHGDLDRIRLPEISHDEKETSRRLSEAQGLFGDILEVRLKGVSHISFHLMNQYTALRGLEQVMVDMCMEPGMLHDAMERLTQGHERVLKQYVDQNLLSLNNDGTYHSSGGVGYTDELPGPGFDPERVRPCDMWASAEAQELALVSPEHHAVFALQHEMRLLAPFGLNGYGCCEDLTGKLDYALTIPNIRRVSIAPSANVDACAEELGGRCIYSWKPNPAHLVGEFSPTRVEAYVQHTIEAAQRHGCVLEIILKDTHTCEHHPERFDEWTRIAASLVGR